MTLISINPIKTELRRIQRLIDLGRIDEDRDRIGSLSLEKRGRRTYCYESIYKDGKRANKRYLGSPDSDAVREYCSLKYRQELVRRLEKNKEILKSADSSFMICDPASVYSSLPASCLRVSSEAYFDERYEELKAWAAADYKKNDYPFPKSIHIAKDGTRVRSKGECVEYNLLLDASIPFRYDSVITIADESGFTKSLSPDFLIQCYDGSFVIIEHLGRIGDKKYSLDYGEKCYWYMQKGFIPGGNFLVTSDDINGGTDSQAIAAVVSRVEQLFWGY